MTATRTEWNHDAAEFALRVIAPGSLDLVEWYFGEAMPIISGCLRGLFVAAPGHDLICSDYSSIEAVVLAELAGEQWRQEVFRTHGKIYETSAAKIIGATLDEFMRHAGYSDAQLATPAWWTLKPANPGKHHPKRKMGKVAELASGYGGWVGSWKAFGADEFLTDDEIRQAVIAWREASPAVVELWGGQERNWRPEFFGIEGAAVSAILQPGVEFSYQAPNSTDRASFVMRGDALYSQLPSGKYLTYHRPRLRPSDRRPGTWAISYEGWNTNPKNGPVGWIRMDTYGPRLVENRVQAVSREIFKIASIAAERAGYHASAPGGYPIVLHTYDEITAEVPGGTGSVEEFERIMSTMPPWAATWPVKAKGGWRGKRYRK